MIIQVARYLDVRRTAEVIAVESGANMSISPTPAGSGSLCHRPLAVRDWW